ncbi:MAG: DegT/DnrJ/EryC1/StrS family aminotransferase [Actinomycetota bacterium]
MNQQPILLSPPDVGELEQEYVLNAMKSGWVAPAGPDLQAFEREVADRVGIPHAVALSSGTAALHLALVSWGVGPGDVVVTSTMTFAATANAVIYTGAEPFFVDCTPETANMDPQLLEQALQRLTAAGRRVPVVIPVDMLGKSADYTRIEPLARRFGARVLSDAAESFGASHAGKPAGSHGDAAVLSFNGNKIMTTSGGGMLLTRDEEVAGKVRYFSTQARQPVAHYEHTDVGYNYRLSNILAALGRAQLARLDEMMKRRREWRERYRELFAGCSGVSVIGGHDDGEDNCWLTAVVVNSSEAGWSARRMREALAREGIESRPVWKPLHLQPVFAGTDREINGSAEELFKNGITLPSGSAMSNDDFHRVARVIQGVVG